MAQAGGGQGRGGTRLAWGRKSAVSLNTLPDPAQRQTLLQPELHEGCTPEHPSVPAPRCPPPQWLHPALGTADLAGRGWTHQSWHLPCGPVQRCGPARCSCPGCCRGPHSAPAGSPSPRPPACPWAPAARGCCGSVAPGPRGPAPCLRPCPLQGLLPGSGVPAGGQELLKWVPAYPSLLTARSLRAGQRAAIKRRRPGRAPRYHRRDAAKPSSPARSPPNLIIAGRPLLPPASPPNPLANCRDSQLLSGCWVNSGLIR